MKTAQTLKISAYFIDIERGKRVVAYSPVLDISTVGKDVEEAQKRFTEISELFFEELRESGTLQDTLRTLGWKKDRATWRAPEVSNKTVRISLSSSR